MANFTTEKYFKEFIWFFFCRGEGAATRRLPCLRYGSHYLEVGICDRWTFLCENPIGFQVGKKNAVVLVWGRQILENSS